MSASTGIRPLVPITQYVLKVHSRCKFACDYCYMYEHVDQSWHGRPAVMSEDTVGRVTARIAEHAAAHRIPLVSVGLHGGEPLLVGHDRLAAMIREIRDSLAGVCDVHLWVQTNGVLLDGRFLDLFLEHGITVGVSLDGDRAANDRHRRYANGRSSYAQVTQALTLLNDQRYRRLYGGVLCVVDIANDPIAVYDGLTAFEPPQLDLLLPHATWDNPPPRLDGGGTEYADWLIALYERWSRDGRPFPIRIFDAITDTSWGGASGSESVGLAQVDLIVVETDGTLELVDSLKTAYEGAPFTGLDVVCDSFDDAASHPGVTARQSGIAGLCTTCQDCPVVQSCGGGLYPHRYRTGSGFDNPSVYCDDLKKLINHIRSRIGWKGLPLPSEAAPVHITEADFKALSAGFGDASAIVGLTVGQKSLRRALVATVHRNLGSVSHRAAWDLISELDRNHPAALADVLAHPYVRAWAMECLTQPADPESRFAEHREAAGAPLLASVAAAAAVRAGVRANLRIPLSQGQVVLPTLGVALFDGVDADDVQFECADGRFSLRAGALAFDSGQAGRAAPFAAEGIWKPIRHVVVDGLRVCLEDTDPHRDRYDSPVAPRLSDAEVEVWREALGDAWNLIKEDYPAYAPAMAEGFSTVTPLSAAPRDYAISATLRDAFGAVGIARPEDPVTLALLLIHEFQHAKLGAVLDVCSLYDRADTRMYRTAWREDRRPLEGLLQGAYAHIGVTDFWRVRSRRVDGKAAAYAAEQFAKWYAGTAQAIDDLLRSGSLTAAGESFIRGMRSTLDQWAGALDGCARSQANVACRPE